MGKILSLSAALLLSLGACSSTSGSGATPSSPGVIVIPSGSIAVCSDGSPPPCR